MLDQPEVAHKPVESQRGTRAVFVFLKPV